MNEPNDPAITIKDLHKKYHKKKLVPGKRGFLRLRQKFRKEEVHALKGISLDVHQGEILGLLGPNGEWFSWMHNYTYEDVNNSKSVFWNGP